MEKCIVYEEVVMRNKNILWYELQAGGKPAFEIYTGIPERINSLAEARAKARSLRDIYPEVNFEIYSVTMLKRQVAMVG